MKKGRGGGGGSEVLSSSLWRSVDHLGGPVPAGQVIIDGGRRRHIATPPSYLDRDMIVGAAFENREIEMVIAGWKFFFLHSLILFRCTVLL